MVWSMILAAFVLSVALCGLAKWLFPKIGLMDRPHHYGLLRPAVPYPGGAMLFVSFLLLSLLFLPLDRQVLSVLVGGTLLAVTSFFDDRLGLPPWLRLVVQFLAGISLVIGGIGIASITNPLGGALVLDQWEIVLNSGFVITVFADVLTVIWVMVMVNAFNWVDGVPGMADSVAAVAAAILLVLSTRPDFHFMDQSLAIALSSIVLGMSAAHLIFDFPPPRMLLGDTGSMLLGFLLAVIAIISGGKIATMLLVLGFPILDFVWVIGRRLWKGKSPFKGDLWHFHHRLQKAGFKDSVIVIFFAVTAALFGGLALSLHTEGKVFAFGGILGLMLLLATLLYYRR